MSNHIALFLYLDNSLSMWPKIIQQCFKRNEVIVIKKINYHKFPQSYIVCIEFISFNLSMGTNQASVRGHPVSWDNQLHIKTFQSMHPCSNDAIVTSHNRPHIETLQSAPFCCDNGIVTSHNRLPIEAFQSAGPYIPPHHCPTFASHVRPHMEAFQSMGPHTPSYIRKKYNLLWLSLVSLAVFGSIWLDLKIWKNAEKS